MDTKIQQLLKALRGGERDGATLETIENLLDEQRASLIASGDSETLAEISKLLKQWAENAPDELSARALFRAAELAFHAGEKAVAAEIYRGLGEHRVEILGDLDGGIKAFESALDASASVKVIGRLAVTAAMRTMSRKNHSSWPRLIQFQACRAGCTKAGTTTTAPRTR